ncbi:hypothetical protein CTI12_AA476760 [Artemisia annua]|uniref:Uncharacterized protein n=1 Tax=Artemisia annua TaxID=35608 RepID=A0A2U1LKC6_ARTAN|nr:hypothetical protein CTI12_AA476760 [Artemisia annua]
MRCKKHYTDLSSINGVCATCLRQRLFILIQHQSQNQSQSLDDEQQDTVFPRSVSPYINHNRPRQHSVTDHRVSNSVTGETASATSSTSSPSWFRRNKHKQQPVVNGVVRKQFCPDRGMSPARYSDCGEEFCDSGSGYESCESRKQTPWRTPARRVNSTAGLTFCLSPLVRASPCRNWNQKTPPVTTVMTAVDGGDGRGAVVKPHLLNTKSFCANRSRKLADFGRLNPNR